MWWLLLRASRDPQCVRAYRFLRPVLGRARRLHGRAVRLGQRLGRLPGRASKVMGTFFASVGRGVTGAGAALRRGLRRAGQLIARAARRLRDLLARGVLATASLARRVMRFLEGLIAAAPPGPAGAAVRLAVTPVLVARDVLLVLYGVAALPFRGGRWLWRRLPGAWAGAAARRLGSLPATASRLVPWRAAAESIRAAGARIAGVVRLGWRRLRPSPARRVDPFDDRMETLLGEFRRRFPDRLDQLARADMEGYRSVMEPWRNLLARYDLVEAYSTDTILPMLAGVPYVAYEHGTLREIPFHTNNVGRLTALSYALAEHTFVTNPDCVVSADRLGIMRRCFVPHLIDRKYYSPAIRDNGDLPHGVRLPYIFCPSRHDWGEKGTDILVAAFARLAAERPDVQLVVTSWGADIERTRRLVEGLGLDDRVVFIRPLHIHNLIRVAGRAEAVVDQFFYGVFGGIGPSALALGTALVTHLDHAKSSWCMEEPPYYEAFDVASCHRALRAALAGGGAARALERERWTRRNYWHEDVVRRHAEVYMELLVARASIPVMPHVAGAAAAVGGGRVA